MSFLPNEILEKIFSYLSIRDLRKYTLIFPQFTYLLKIKSKNLIWKTWLASQGKYKRKNISGKSTRNTQSLSQLL